MYNKLIAIAAMASNGVIGKDGKLPWHLPEDLKFFKETTLNQTVLMGRKTYDSIIAAIGKPLPKRQSIVLSNTMTSTNDVTVIKSLDELKDIPTTENVYVIGGASLYNILLPICDELILTFIYYPYKGDTYFPSMISSFESQKTIMNHEKFDIGLYKNINK